MSWRDPPPGTRPSPVGPPAPSGTWARAASPQRTRRPGCEWPPSDPYSLTSSPAPDLRLPLLPPLLRLWRPYGGPDVRVPIAPLVISPHHPHPLPCLLMPGSRSFLPSLSRTLNMAQCRDANRTNRVCFITSAGFGPVPVCFTLWSPPTLRAFGVFPIPLPDLCPSSVFPSHLCGCPFFSITTAGFPSGVAGRTCGAPKLSAARN